MNDGKVNRCNFCGRLYKIYMYTSADQSACPKCVQEATDIVRWDKFKNKREPDDQQTKN